MSTHGAVLFVSLGASPAIVPEAFLFPGVEFRVVHVLTTEKTSVSLIQEFFAAHAPMVSIRIARVAGFEDLRSESDHFHFEEVLFRWVLDSATKPEDRYFCHAGGFKTMSAAMQKVAGVFGAAEVFHVLADKCFGHESGEPREPRTVAEIFEARGRGHLRFIRLGPEPGWPQLRMVRSRDYPLRVSREEPPVRWIGAPDSAFRDHLKEVLERSQRIAGAWSRLPDLPVPELGTWPAAGLAWLDSPLDPEAPEDRAWVSRIPKVELHCHLGGFATYGETLGKVRSAAVAPSSLPRPKELDPPPNWPLPPQPIGLKPYCSLGENNGSVLLRDRGCLRRQCELLYQHLLEQNVVYAEVRCSPANYVSDNRSPWDVLVDIRAAFEESRIGARTREGLVCNVNLILIATRREEGDYRAAIARHLSLAVTAAEHWQNPDTCRVVGVDLAGFEDPQTRAHYFRDEFTAIHRCGLAVTIHAGENDDAEGIWRAVFDLNARRLGHALTLRQSPELLRSVADRGIAVEMCPYANLQIRGFPLDEAVSRSPTAQRYPLLDYLRQGVVATVNTDNIGISAASLTDNLLLAARLCPGLTRLELLRLQRHAIDAAFLPMSRRRALSRAFAAMLLPP